MWSIQRWSSKLCFFFFFLISSLFLCCDGSNSNGHDCGIGGSGVVSGVNGSSGGSGNSSDRGGGDGVGWGGVEIMVDLW